MHGASRLALPRLRVRAFSPLAKLGPLRAPRGGCRALSEDFRVEGVGGFGAQGFAPFSRAFPGLGAQGFRVTKGLGTSRLQVSRLGGEALFQGLFSA